jgi:hypothetical protein
MISGFCDFAVWGTLEGMHRLKLKTAVRLLDHLMAQGFFVPSTDAEEYKRGDISSEAGDFGSKRGDPLTRDCTDINAVIIDCGGLLKARTMLEGLGYSISSKEIAKSLGV